MDGDAIPDSLDPVLVEVGQEPGPAGPAESAVILEPVSAESPSPWGPWATIGWTLLCLATMVVAQTAVAIAFVLVRVALNPQEKIADIAANGNMIMLAGLANTPPVVGLVALLIVFRLSSVTQGEDRS